MFDYRFQIKNIQFLDGDKVFFIVAVRCCFYEAVYVFNGFLKENLMSGGRDEMFTRHTGKRTSHYATVCGTFAAAVFNIAVFTLKVFWDFINHL